MSDHIDSITDAYRCLVKGLSPKKDVRALATTLCAAICGCIPVAERDSCHVCQSRNYPDGFHYTNVEFTCIALTLIEKIVSNLMSQRMSAETKMYFMETLRLLFQEMDCMSKLVESLKAENQLIAHLAAKSVSKCVFYELQNYCSVSPIWQHRCVQAFENASPGNELDSYIWSFTSVLKQTLKVSVDCETEMLERLLEAFDPHLSGLYARLFPEGAACGNQAAVSDAATTFSSLLDLLEVLTATVRVCRPAGALLQSQRLAHTHAAALLAAGAATSASYSVKKQAVLVLKRTLLQKAGEDMALGALGDGRVRDDTTPLADAVLQAVAAGWLRRVAVEPASSCLGGRRRDVGSQAGQRCDYVMLRAVCLVVVKALEVRSQSAPGASGLGVAMELHPCLRALLVFLGQRGVPLEEVTHACSWLSIVFAEQDDDMMEAAKALLALSLHHSRVSTGHRDVTAASEAACAAGANPHCHFLSLLRGVCFDHGVLLDFLISTETCFLEYLVRYLRLLRAQLEAFVLACRRADADPDPDTVPAAASPSNNHDADADATAMTWSLPGAAVCGSGDWGGGAARWVPGPVGLVDYDDSSEDEADSAGSKVTKGEHLIPAPTTSGKGSKVIGGEDLMSAPPASGEGSLRGAGENQEPRRVPVTLGNVQLETGPVAVGYVQPAAGPGRGARCRLRCARKTHGGQTPVPHALPWRRATDERTALCLLALRDVITRLHAKNLFPYNPSSLLKLLAEAVGPDLLSQ